MSGCRARAGSIDRVLMQAGAVMLGKSNMPDLALSNESDNHLIGATTNPFDPTRTAGGSTGGGAAAIATGMAAFDWGGDFGGSIRTPAACCGIVGIRLSSQAWPASREQFPGWRSSSSRCSGWGRWRRPWTGFAP